MPKFQDRNSALGSAIAAGPARVSTRTRGPALRAVEHPAAATLAAAPAAEVPVDLTDPAMLLVTDFATERPETVQYDCLIDDALLQMRRATVRSLLVVRGQQLRGLVTSYDIQGERPMQVLHELGFQNHADIEVRHIMTPLDRVPALDLDTVREAQVHQVVEFFRGMAATHILVIENTADGTPIVRGLISRTRVERQVGFCIT